MDFGEQPTVAVSFSVAAQHMRNKMDKKTLENIGKKEIRKDISKFKHSKANFYYFPGLIALKCFMGYYAIIPRAL